MKRALLHLGSYYGGMPPSLLIVPASSIGSSRLYWSNGGHRVCSGVNLSKVKNIPCSARARCGSE